MTYCRLQALDDMVFTQTRILSSIYELETSAGIISRTTRDAGIYTRILIWVTKAQINPKIREI